ncbi:hypothetical protein LOAG_03087 [Loa loa]|uniref:Uncharacterized protein n=1 Tax=Loa loa TaxID=7209 RepID=A0A1I7VKD0_LOALO|nr:hypothetical protein LOAG_03087 [Loa loa]EFO25395.1 hypothetical protein LOAG_03087 [Loa loa]
MIVRDGRNKSMIEWMNRWMDGISLRYQQLSQVSKWMRGGRKHHHLTVAVIVTAIVTVTVVATAAAAAAAAGAAGAVAAALPYPKR